MTDKLISDGTRPVVGAPDISTSLLHLLPVLRRICEMIRCSWGRAILVGACLTLASVSEPAMVAIIKYTIDWGKISMPAWISYPMLPACVLLVFIVRGVATAGSSHLLGGINADLISNVQAHLYRHTLSLADTTYAPLPVGRLVQLLTFEVKQFADLVERIVGRFIRHFLSLTALYASLFVLNWRLTLVASLALPVVFTVCKALGKRVKTLTQENIALNERLVDIVSERCRKANAVKLHGAVEHELKLFDESVHRLRLVQLRLYSAIQISAPLSQILIMILVGAILVYTVQAVELDTMTKGDAAAYVANLFLIMSPLKYLAELTGPILRSLSGVQKVLDVERIPQRIVLGPRTDSPALGEVQVKNLWARYSDEGNPVLKGISFQVAPGEVIAFIGPSGAGKSSLFRALLGGLAISGEILLNGYPLTARSKDENGLDIAVVPQHAEILNRTILDNIAYGDEQPDIDRVWRALEDVQLDGFVRALPLGINTWVKGGGLGLSGGQARLLVIARAIYSRARILLLDEPAASLDIQAQRSLCISIERLRKTMTVLLITHHHSLLSVANRVITMRDGCIIHSGTYR